MMMSGDECCASDQWKSVHSQEGRLVTMDFWFELKLYPGAITHQKSWKRTQVFFFLFSQHLHGKQGHRSAQRFLLYSTTP